MRKFRYLVLLGGWSAVALAQLDRIPPPSAANPLIRNTDAIARGQDRFRQLCTSCHGRNGEGGQGEGQGPNLMTSWEVRRATDARLFESIKSGVKGTAMPAFPLPEAQVWELLAFVRSLNAPANSIPLPGDPQSGEQIFFGKGGCSTCHMVSGRGGFLGPDLSDIGAARRASELRTAIVAPKKTPSAEYTPIVISEVNGTKLRAVARHHSTWSIQALDENGGVHLLHRGDVKKAVFQSKSWMPDDLAQRLSAQEIDNLVAYLGRQSLRPPGVDRTLAAPRTNGGERQ